jgi:hypothetical protein
MAERFAIVTPSYRGDLDRCRLLCASIDAFVSDMSTHYLLVEDRDLALFRPLLGPRRRIVAESELFPNWLRSFPDPLSFGRRRIWTGAGAIARGLGPLRGWHTQQLRKMAVPRLVDEDVLLFADSDVIFLRPYALSSQIVNGATRLYRRPGGLTADMAEHVDWLCRAAGCLRIAAPALPADDYINNLVTWRADNARSMLSHIENGMGRHWIEAAASSRGFSEWLLYGLHADRVLGAASRHAPTSRPLASTYWDHRDVDRAAFGAGTVSLEPDQVAVGVQSFIGVPLTQLWDLFRAFDAAKAEPGPDA